MSVYLKIYQWLIIFIIAFLASFSLSLPSEAKSDHVYNYNTSHFSASQNWGSLLMKLGSKGGGRALVASKSGSTNFILFFEYRFSNCSHVLVGLIDNKNKNSPKSIRGLTTIKVRVDRGAIFHYMAYYVGERGDNSIFWYLKIGKSARQKLLKAVKNGQTLRFKLSGKATKKHFLSFSLNGSSAAINRAHRLCISQQPARNFFPNTNKKYKKQNGDKSNQKRSLKHPQSPPPKKAQSHRVTKSVSSKQNNEANHNDKVEPSTSKGYTAELSQEIAAHKRYPKAAKRQNQQGRVEVRVVIQKSGKVSHLSISKSSGHKLLDQAALKAVKKAEPFGALPASMQKSQLAIIVPFEFGRNQ